MSKVCETCGKHPRAGMNVSHSNRHTKRRFLPNIIEKKIDGVRKKLCTACLRTTQKKPRVKNAKKTVAASSAA